MRAPPDDRPRVLILGGTVEARELAERLDAAGVTAPITSLAGRTRWYPSIPGDLRVGAFGGALRLKAYLAEKRIAAVLDATHPFAIRISRNARRAALAAGVARLRLWRPPWTRASGDRWRIITRESDLAPHSAELGQRPFVTLGRSGPRLFPTFAFSSVVFRSIEAPAVALAANARWFPSRPPFSVADELSRFADLGCDVLVTKNSGGAMTAAKLEAARRRGMPVVMLERPPPPPGPMVETTDAALAWLETTL